MNLKSFREDKLKIRTQAEFADLIGVDQSSISRWEKDPSSMPVDVIQKILVKTGATFEELTGWTKPIPKQLDVDDTWQKADFTKCTLMNYISKALGKYELPEDLQKNYLDGLRSGIETNMVKPKIAIVGRSDTGKSTIINAFLGSDKMPVAWTPTTSIAVYIKHISERPSFIEEEAWVFANRRGDEVMWDEHKLTDEAYCREWKIAAGGVEILRSFGTRQGENYDKAAGSAVVFLDAPILKTCDIIDLPGFGTETESDDNITFAAAQKADAIIYLSQANGFMRIEDITYLKRNITQLPVWESCGSNDLAPLSNLFVVASQAHTVNNGNRAQLTEILDVGCRNLLKTLPEEYWAERMEASGFTYSDGGWSELRSRFFPYTVDIPDLSEPLNNSLKSLLETLPLIIEGKVRDFVKSYVESRKPNLEAEIKNYEGIIADRDKYATLLREIDDKEADRVRENDARKEDVRASITRLHQESVNEFTDYLASTVNVDALVQLMHEKGVKNRREDVELFGSTLQSLIQGKCESILKDKSKELAEKTKDYVSAFSQDIAETFENNSIQVDFDAGWIFTSALSALGAIGGFGAFLAFTLPHTLALAGLGFSAGSSILYGMMASSVFGPIGLALGLIFATCLGISLFTGGWEKSVAKKIVKAFDENDFAVKFQRTIEEYWDQTEKAFDKAAADLDEKWDHYVADLRNLLDTCDIDEIQQKIAALQYISDFFDNIPL